MVDLLLLIDRRSAIGHDGTSNNEPAEPASSPLAANMDAMPVKGNRGPPLN
jgi:hypothetical protein